MSDPDDLPGLAHFCEHMLFLGTEKVRINKFNLFRAPTMVLLGGSWSSEVGYSKIQYPLTVGVQIKE